VPHLPVSQALAHRRFRVMSRSMLRVLLRVLLHAASTAAKSPRLNRQTGCANGACVVDGRLP
jgi:hypothetical protein